MNDAPQTTADLPRQRAGQGAGTETEVAWIPVWRAVRKHWPVAAMSAVLVMLAVAVYTLGQTKIYQASSTIEVDPSPPKPLGNVQTVVDMGASNYEDNHEYLMTQYKVIQSKRVALAVVKRLGLSHDSSFIKDVPPGTSVSGQAVTSDEVATDVVRGRLSVEPVKDSRLAVVRYEDASPERAQRVLSAVLDTYISQNLDDTLADVNSAVDWLRSQLDRLNGDLQTSEMALQEFKEQKNVLALEVDEESNTLHGELRHLSEQLTAVRGRHQELAAKVSELEKVPEDNPRSLGAPELMSSSLLQVLRQRFEDAIHDRDGLLGQGKGENHPDVRRAEAGLEAARTAVVGEIKNVRLAAARELAATEKEEAGLNALVTDAQRRAVDVNLLQIQYGRLRRARENNEKLYTLVLERTTETDLQRLLRVNNLRVVDAPDLARSPFKPRIAAMALLGIVGGIAMGVGVALTLVALDRTVKTPENVEEDLGITCLGMLPILDVRRGSGYSRKRRRARPNLQNITPELVVHEAPLSNVAEAARAIRTNLMFMATDNPIRTLLVTSANPGEGKTTLACCIAIAIAHAGHRTLLVDCDLRRPRIHRVFGKSSDVGVSTVLIDESTLDRAIQPTDIANLFVLTAGPLPPNPADLMHSERFRKLIRDLRGRFDRVVFDSSPVAPVTDATILSAYVDATMLVVRSYTTRKDAARHALRAILDIGSKTAGVVLNAVDFSRHEYKYATYYGRYGYGTPYGDTSTDRLAGQAGANNHDGPEGESPSAPT